MLDEMNHALNQVIADVHARRDILKKRKVTLSIYLEPKPRETNTLDLLGVDYQISTAVPSRLGNRQDALIEPDTDTGDFDVLVVVDPILPGNYPGQKTIFDSKEEEVA